MNIQVINRSQHPLPEYQTAQAAGMDLRASLTQPLCLRPSQRQLIPTGIFVAIPEGFHAEVRPRSGLALRHGLTVLNAPGTIDADYRGEIKVLLINLGDKEVWIEDGDRIAQLVVVAQARVAWIPVETLENTLRGGSGYGSTGER
ncbi:MAG: dUTP diphosphatase [Bernardetiaceae bacterium]